MSDFVCPHCRQAGGDPVRLVLAPAACGCGCGWAGPPWTVSGCSLCLEGRVASFKRAAVMEAVPVKEGVDLSDLMTVLEVMGR